MTGAVTAFGDDGELTAKEALFVHYYVTNNFNASAAARSAGYSEASANVQSAKLMAKPRVKAAIDKLVGGKLKELKIDANRVLEELAAMAFMPLDTVLTPGFNPEEPTPVTLLATMKVNDKKGSLELLGKHLKMWTDKVEVTDDRPKVVIRDLTGKKKPAGNQ